MKGSAKVIGEMKWRRAGVGKLASALKFCLPTATQGNKLGFRWDQGGFMNPYLGGPRIIPIRE